MLPVGLACEVWMLGQALDLILEGCVTMVHDHHSLIGSLIRQGWRQGQQTAGQLGFGIRLLLLMQECVACHLQGTAWFCALGACSMRIVA